MSMIIPIPGVVAAFRQANEACDPYWDQVVLAMHMDGADNGTTFTDEKGKTVTRFGDTVTKTGVKKFGTASAYFDGNGDYIETETSVDFQLLDARDFTIEFWVNPDLIPTSNRYIFGDGLAVWVKFSPSGLELNLGDYPISVIAGEWTHVAWVLRHTNPMSPSIGNIYSFKDGILVSDIPISHTILTSAVKFQIGTAPSISGSSNGLTGYIDDLLVTRYAKYTEDFDPPTQAFPDVAC
jgi:hypothetical protein